METPPRQQYTGEEHCRPVRRALLHSGAIHRRAEEAGGLNIIKKSPRQALNSVLDNQVIGGISFWLFYAVEMAMYHLVYKR